MGNVDQINRRCAIFQNVHRHVIGSLQDMLLQLNNLIKTFKTAKILFLMKMKIIKLSFMLTVSLLLNMNDCTIHLSSTKLQF